MQLHSLDFNFIFKTLIFAFDFIGSEFYNNKEIKNFVVVSLQCPKRYVKFVTGNNGRWTPAIKNFSVSLLAQRQSYPERNSLNILEQSDINAR
jgi:hypothetical protein